MARPLEQQEPWEESARRRLAAGNFFLETQESAYGIGCIVRSSTGDVVFGMCPSAYGATPEDVENFLKAQEL